ncbi:hypothetical protein KIW84_022186 [Lathyrus oleraceus]|uniref:Uncharacterized protein n=1 Tax=Pisum sativum TaxID=3888 RepID=A0A9D5B6B8_PEA|nr:hypothetical protein KIW84_022186 [Pisum sativum]
MDDFTHGNKEVIQGMPKKRTQENLQENNREKIQKVDKAFVKNVLITSKNKKSKKPNISLDTVMSKTQCSKKAKRVPTCPSMLIDDYVELQKPKGKDATKSNNGENRETTFIHYLVNIKERTCGKTWCKKIHGRTLEEREQVTINEDGRPIGPTSKVVSDLSLFLGTLARNSTFCPLIFTNWTRMPTKKKTFWRYIKQKFILPIEARNWVLTTVRDSWRRYKHKIKKNHFLKYSNMTERLKHSLPRVPKAHFRNLCKYWNKELIQAIGEKNTRNRAQLNPNFKKTIENEGNDTEAFEAVFGNERPGRINMESIEYLLGLSHRDVNSDPKESVPQMHSSILTHALGLLKQDINKDVDEDDGVSDQFHEDDSSDEDEVGEELQEDEMGDELQEDNIDDEEDDEDDDEFDKLK